MQYHWMVCVRCITYNHAPYITEALEGFAMQQTSFPYVCCIIDDASTDGEQEIIKRYLENNFDQYDINTCRYEETDDYFLFFAHHKTNLNCYFAVLYLKYNHYSKPGCNQRKLKYIAEWNKTAKYYALCEGDDYWIDSNKLQKQVEYMDSNPECSYLFTDRYIDHEKLGIRQEIRYQKKKYSTHDILSGFIPGLQTVMYRPELMGSPILQTKGINGDRLYAYAASTIGEVHCLHEITAVYRNTGKGVSTGVSQDVFFSHVVSDMMRFHRNLGVHDWWAYLNGQSHKLGSYGSGLPRWKRLCGAYYGYRKIDSRIGVFSYIIMVLLFLKKQLYMKLNIYDPKRYIIKDN